jgi:hypothetical protein
MEKKFQTKKSIIAKILLCDNIHIRLEVVFMTI